MKPIELERWEPSPDDPRREVYAGQRTAQEVFEELKYRLEGMGYLPDEYFLMNHEWEDGREIPKDADIFCTTDYGGSEGIYTDIYLKWYQDGEPVIRSFATGKTLGESGSDMDRMYLIASAIIKAFHGESGTYARYLRLGEQPEPEDMILHLNPDEQRIFINALVEQRERQEQAMSQTEQLLRRMTGSITAYMDEVGQRPLRLSDYDRAVLAIRDGEFDAFCSLYPKVPDRADDLLIEAAGRPGRTGGNMVQTLLSAVERFSPEAYLTACKRAVETGDGQRVRTMVDVLHTLTGQHQNWMAERLLEHGMPVAPNNYAALYVCLNNGAADIGKLLLDRGIDLERYQAWAEHRPKSEEYGAAMEDLAEYWAQTQIGPQQDGPFLGDMSL